VNAQAGRGDENQICVANVFEGPLRFDLDGTVTQDSLPVSGGSGDMKAGILFGPGKNIPQRAGMTEHFERANGRRRKRLIEKQHCDLCHVYTSKSSKISHGVIASLEWQICHLVASSFRIYFHAIE
jgi:hypothetical protein